MQNSSIHDRCDVPGERLHVGSHVARSIPSRSSSHFKHVDKDRTQCLNVCEVEKG